jgi:hypothetical protein
LFGEGTGFNLDFIKVCRSRFPLKAKIEYVAPLTIKTRLPINTQPLALLTFIDKSLSASRERHAIRLWNLYLLRKLLAQREWKDG